MKGENSRFGYGRKIIRELTREEREEREREALIEREKLRREAAARRKEH